MRMPAQRLGHKCLGNLPIGETDRQGLQAGGFERVLNRAPGTPVRRPSELAHGDTDLGFALCVVERKSERFGGRILKEGCIPGRALREIRRCEPGDQVGLAVAESRSPDPIALDGQKRRKGAQGKDKRQSFHLSSSGKQNSSPQLLQGSRAFNARLRKGLTNLRHGEFGVGVLSSEF